MKTNAILVIWGEGGHAEQMRRILEGLKVSQEVFVVGMTDADRSVTGVTEKYVVPPLRLKARSNRVLFQLVSSLAAQITILLRLLGRYRFLGMVSSGPGIALLPAIVFRMIGKPVIYFESWSRVSRVSSAARLCRPFASLFFVQHESLLTRVSGAIYKGRL